MFSRDWLVGSCCPDLCTMVKRGTGRKHWEKRRMGRKIIMKTGGKIASWWKTKAVIGAAICRSVEGMEVR